MKMSYPSLGHRNPEDLKFHEWEDGGWGLGLRLPLSDCFVLGKDPRARKTAPLRFHWEMSVLKASWLWVLAELWEWVWKAWAETPLNGVRKGEEMTAGTFSLLSWALFSPSLFFPSFAKHFPEMGYNQTVG